MSEWVKDVPEQKKKFWKIFTPLPTVVGCGDTVGVGCNANMLYWVCEIPGSNFTADGYVNFASHGDIQTLARVGRIPFFVCDAASSDN